MAEAPALSKSPSTASEAPASDGLQPTQEAYDQAAEQVALGRGVQVQKLDLQDQPLQMLTREVRVCFKLLLYLLLFI